MKSFSPIRIWQLMRMLPIEKINTNHILPAFVLINIQQMRRNLQSTQLRHHADVRLEIIEATRGNLMSYRCRMLAIEILTPTCHHLAGSKIMKMGGIIIAVSTG